MRNEAGSKLDKSAADWIQLAPVLWQNPHFGLALSHFVRLALHT
jgi:hypothetical protein